MLVLSRKKEEKLQIGDQITITVLRVKGNTVQLGIEAPGNVRVLREELTTRQPNDFPTGTSAPTTREAGAPKAADFASALASETQEDPAGFIRAAMIEAGLPVTD